MNGKNNEPFLVLDIDGVVLDYTAGFIERMTKMGHHPRKTSTEMLDYMFCDIFPELTLAEVANEISLFSREDGFSRLRTYDDAAECLISFRHAFPSISIIGVTACGDSADTIHLRAHNLRQLPFDHIYHVPLSGSKAQVLSQLPKGSLYFDDALEHVEEAIRNGLVGVHVEQSYNRRELHENSVAGWLAIGDMLQSHFNSLSLNHGRYAL